MCPTESRIWWLMCSNNTDKNALDMWGYVGDVWICRLNCGSTQLFPNSLQSIIFNDIIHRTVIQKNDRESGAQAVSAHRVSESELPKDIPTFSVFLPLRASQHRWRAEWVAHLMVAMMSKSRLTVGAHQTCYRIKRYSWVSYYNLNYINFYINSLNIAINAFASELKQHLLVIYNFCVN